MALTDYKITETEKSQYQLRNNSAPDVLTGSADENKQVFDRLSLFIADKYNNALDGISESFSAQNTKSDTIRSELQAEIDDISGNVNPLSPLGMYSTIEDLREAHPTGEIGEAWMVGTASSNTVYLWDINEEDWVDIGGLVNANGFKTAYNKSFEDSSSNIQMDGTADAGLLDTVARADHVHPTDTSRASQTDMLAVQGILDNLIDYVYPVGSIYLSVNNVNPSTLFGGTWEQIKDKFLLACGTTYNNATTGGSATHKLTVSEMPSHTHTQNAHYHGTNNFVNYNTSYTADVRHDASGYRWGTSIDLNTNNATATNQNTGGSQAHNNMPPYLAVSVWKRTA